MISSRWSIRRRRCFLKLLDLIPPGDGCGWGVAGSYLFKHLPQHCEIVTEVADCDAVLAPVSNFEWGYAIEHEGAIRSARAAGKKVIGYGFHEFDILGTKQISMLADNWDALICGSTWMKEWVVDALKSIKREMPVSVALQGVDTERFYYRVPNRPDWMKDRFVIASCGKFEYRKSQDVIIEAFRRFQKSVPEAMLLMCWHNPWPDTMRTMGDSKYAHNLELQSDQAGNISILGVDRKLIDPKDQVSWLMSRNMDMPAFYQNADIALFPNRCEAGQAMPACEALASGIPSVVVDGHGMRDLVDIAEESACTFLEGGKRFNYRDVGTFTEPCLSEINSEMMRLYRENHGQANRMHLSHLMESLSWDQTAKDVVAACREVVE